MATQCQRGGLPSHLARVVSHDGDPERGEVEVVEPDEGHLGHSKTVAALLGVEAAELGRGGIKASVPPDLRGQAER